MKDYNNIIAFIIGLSTIGSCLLMTFLSQKLLFKKYAKKINNSKNQ